VSFYDRAGRRRQAFFIVAGLGTRISGRRRRHRSIRGSVASAVHWVVWGRGGWGGGGGGGGWGRRRTPGHVPCGRCCFSGDSRFHGFLYRSTITYSGAVGKGCPLDFSSCPNREPCLCRFFTAPSFGGAHHRMPPASLSSTSMLSERANRSFRRRERNTRPRDGVPNRTTECPASDGQGFPALRHRCGPSANQPNLDRLVAADDRPKSA